VPTSVLKELADDISPFLATLINRYLTEGVFPAALKTASITPRLEKPNMDDTDVRSYRPISNLPVISKLIERLVAKRLINYLTTNDMLSRHTGHIIPRKLRWLRYTVGHPTGVRRR